LGTVVTPNPTETRSCTRYRRVLGLLAGLARPPAHRRLATALRAARRARAAPHRCWSWTAGTRSG